jgi:hypothetical protein
LDESISIEKSDVGRLKSSKRDGNGYDDGSGLERWTFYVKRHKR